MGIQCRLIENPELNSYGNVDTTKRAVGDMWFLDLPEEELKQRPLTAQYWRDNAGRKPLVVMLPGHHYFLVDGQCFDQARGHYDGWTVTGTPPNLTVSPSIDMKGRWHGWLRNGVLDDA